VRNNNHALSSGKQGFNGGSHCRGVVVLGCASGAAGAWQIQSFD
jgi:hypothetical protein